ncbi:MAG: hypothetical protein GY765_14695, partial [bacterium]|nr:hypothetical protein [bacterium]
IPYQLEQLHSQEYPFSETMEKVLRHASMVWDYSEKNIAFLAEKGITARRLVPGYHENLELVKPAANCSVDVLFYGSLGERRKKVLEKLSETYKVKALFGVYGEKRDKWIARSRLVLNMHHYSTQIFEAVRISYLLNNGCFILSENSVNYPYSKVELPLVPYGNLVESCLEYLSDPRRMERIGRENYRDFKANYHITEMIREMI